MKQQFKQFLVIILLGAALLSIDSPMYAQKIKVIVLAGQSNARGHGLINPISTKGTLSHFMANDLSNEFENIQDENGKWATRNDVWVRYDHEEFQLLSGELTAGFGAWAESIGPEFGLGYVLGDYFNEQVLIIKTCWGGKNLAVDFRPPSSGGTVGPFYSQMITDIKTAINNIKTEFPNYKGEAIEIAGFVWFQGWNDLFEPAYLNEYQQNLINLISDVRSDLNAPNLPVVVGLTGNGGYNGDASLQSIQASQINAAEYSSHQFVTYADTRPFWREPNISPSDFYHHWNHNAESYLRIGNAFGTKLVELIDQMPDVSQCPMGQSELIINIVPDKYPGDISWKLFEDNILKKSGLFNSDTVCVDISGCIRFEIYDSYGDGLNDNGPGSYHVYFHGGDTIAMGIGNDYTREDITEFNCIADTLEIMTALQAMIAHVNGSKPLGLAQRQQYYHEIIWDYAEVFPLIKSDVHTYIKNYEANFPVLFENRAPVDFNGLAPETRLLISFQQYILDTQCTSDNAVNMEGIIFEVSNIFPGPVAAVAPRVNNAVVPINGTHVRIPSAIIAFDDIPAKRPTGYYAPPGEIVTIIIPAHLTKAGLVAQIGAHHIDHGTWLNRLPRISNDFLLDSTHTQIISPIGGGIYIKVPEPSKLGWFDIVIDKAVKSPYFSLRKGHESAPSEWATDLNNHFVEWVDLESDKFMMTLPLQHLKDLNLTDPTLLLSRWDDIMDAYNYLGGRPDDVRVKAEYFAIDSRLGGVYGIGYPQIIGEWDAPFGPFNVADFYPTQVLNNPLHIHQNNASGLYIVFHEMGHANAHPKLETERETIVHIYATYIYNVLYGIPLDEAFKYSSFQLMTLDQAAFDWMITHNFRRNANMGCDPVEPPGACDELQYQHRGHAKYIEMAKHYGWSSIHGMNKVFYDQDVIDPGVWDDIFKNPDEMIAAASNAQGLNLSPLFHFWGLAPSPQLAMQLDTTYGPDPQLCKMLKHYKTIVPTSVSDVEKFYFDVHSPNGSTINGRFAIYVDEFESKHYYDSMQAQIDFLIDTYGVCETVLAGCDDVLTDKGDATGKYIDNENSFYYICPDSTDKHAVISFTQFNVEPNDALYIYDGPSKNNPLISSGNPPTSSNFPAGGYYGNTLPGIFASTHPTGCLTIQFRTDSNLVDDGWTADVTCEYNIVCNLTIDVVQTPETCYMCNNGSAITTVNGGSGEFTFEWSNGSTSENPGPLAPGVHYVLVTDGNLCTIRDSIIINPYICPGFSILPNVEDVLCFDECNGVVDFALSNGSQNFQVLWADGSIENIREDLCVGTYQITVTDVDNCIASDSVKVYQPEAFLLDSVHVVSSIDGSSGSITIHFIGSQGSITWSLNGMEYISNDSMSFNQIVFSGLTPECYIVTGVDASGCKLVTDSICIENISGIENFDNFKFSVFPNPAVDLIYIGNTPNLKSFSIRIMDMFGTILHTSENQQMVNISTLNPGIYFLTISTNHKIFSQKLIKI